MAFVEHLCNFKYDENESNKEKVFVEEVFWEEMKQEIRTSIVPAFWNCFKLERNPNNDSSPQNVLTMTQFYHFAETVKTLNSNYQKVLNRFFKENLIPNCRKNSEYYCMELKKYLREALLSQIPTNFEKIVYSFYFISFQVFSKVYTSSEADAIKDVKCDGCYMEESSCCCQELTKSINDVNQVLMKFDLLDRITGQTITSLVQERIEDYITNKCQGIFDKSHLKVIERWIQSNIINWLTRIFNNGLIEIEQANIAIKKIVQGFEVKLTYFLYEHFAISLIKSFFSIIIDFPDSTPAIDDLKICMEKIDVRKVLIESIKSSLEKRILHPGVNTKDILTAYVAAIKTIRHLDPSGVILETVTEPIKNYLRKRTDTVRCVVTSLTEEGPTDLSEELAKGEVQKDYMESSTTIDQNEWEKWLPDTFFIQSKSNKSNTKNVRCADIISMVVDIYGSKELFMNEYRNLMADRLLSLTNINTDKELRNLELLKLRFGDTLLHSCEVMLKDIADSKRINSHIQNDPAYIGARNFDISSLIISAQFWPSFNKESLELPADIESEFKQYTKSYESYKGNRTLCWRTVTGRVNIQVEIGHRILDMSVSPTHAIIIYHFQNQSQWSLAELSNVMKVPQSVLRRRIGFWKSYGLLHEISQDVFKANEEEKEPKESMDISISQIENTDEDIESAMASASDQREEELQVFWSYIVGMLTNLDSLPIERIHQMLKLFASNGLGVEFSQEELKNFLQRKVREHKLLFSGGVYQLLK